MKIFYRVCKFHLLPEKNASFRKVGEKNVFHVPSNVKCNETPPKGIP